MLGRWGKCLKGIILINFSLYRGAKALAVQVNGGIHFKLSISILAQIYLDEYRTLKFI